jgi:hypothetical protein
METSLLGKRSRNAVEGGVSEGEEIKKQKLNLISEVSRKIESFKN